MDEYARVTMDIGLKYSLESDYNIFPNQEELCSYDNPNTFVSEAQANEDNTSVILELKCVPTEVPLWMLDLIRQFQLNRTSFSKYIQSMNNASHHNGFYSEHFNFNDRMANVKI